MKSHSEYTWLQSYFDNDAFWLEDVISWDESFNMFLSEYSLFFFLTSPFFVNVHFFLDSIVKMSFIDILLLSESEPFNSSREFFDFVIWGILYDNNINFFLSQPLYYINYQDLFLVILQNSPEPILGLEDYVNSYWFNVSVPYVPSAAFGILSDSEKRFYINYLNAPFYTLLLGDSSPFSLDRVINVCSSKLL